MPQQRLHFLEVRTLLEGQRRRKVSQALLPHFLTRTRRTGKLVDRWNGLWTHLRPGCGHSDAFRRAGYWLDRLGAPAGATVGSASGARWRARARLTIVVIAIAAMPISAAVV